jgi:hypothetical protein
MADLERQLADERRKAIEQVVACQRAERRCNQLDEQLKQSEKQRLDLEVRCRHLTDGLCRAQARQASNDALQNEERERADMTAAELTTVRDEAKFEIARHRGALDELRYLLKAQDAGTGNLSRGVGANNGIGGYPLGTGRLDSGSGFGGALGGEFGADLSRSFPGEHSVRLVGRGTGLTSDFDPPFRAQS